MESHIVVHTEEEYIHFFKEDGKIILVCTKGTFSLSKNEVFIGVAHVYFETTGNTKVIIFSTTSPMTFLHMSVIQFQISISEVETLIKFLTHNV